MRSDEVVLSSSNVVGLVVDMVYDFANANGVFSQHFGKDAEPVRLLLPTIEQLLQSRSSIPFIECTSHYHENQFRTKGLALLCTSDVGRSSCLNPDRFCLRVIKTKNSLFSIGDESMLDQLIKLIDGKVVFVVGATTSSCIKQTVTDLVSRGYKVLIAEDAITSRTSQMGSAAKDVAVWAENENITVVKSWQQIHINDLL